MSSAFYTAMSYNSVISALVGDGVITIANDEDAVAPPRDIAIEVAAESLRLVLDDERLRNHRGENLSAYWGEADEIELRRIMDRIGDVGQTTLEARQRYENHLNGHWDSKWGVGARLRGGAAEEDHQGGVGTSPAQQGRSHRAREGSRRVTPGAGLLRHLALDRPGWAFQVLPFPRGRRDRQSP